ncbi:MAG: VOC family protein [Pseudomonadota bacterium]
MTGRGIDHIGLVSKSLDGLAAQYEALGFTLTPRAYHPDHMGTSNQLVQFKGRNFIELIEVDRPNGIAPPQPGHMSFGHFAQDLLERREGICLVVFRTQDRDADLAAWRAKGLDTYEPFNFERLATLPDGTQQTVRFELGFVTSPLIPDTVFFVCHNRAEEHFWKPEYQVHANGADQIESVVLAAEDPAEHARFFAALFDGQISPCMEGVTVQCAEHGIHICKPDILAARGWTGKRPTDGSAVVAGMNISAPDRADTFTPAGDAGGAFIYWTT